MPLGSTPSFTESMITFLKSMRRVSSSPITCKPVSGLPFREIDTSCIFFITEKRANEKSIISSFSKYRSKRRPNSSNRVSTSCHNSLYSDSVVINSA